MSDKEIKPQPTLGLTKDDLKELLTTIMTEAKKPAPLTDRELAAIDEEQAGRTDVAKSILAEVEGRRAFQRICTHHHIKGDSHGVYILDGNYVLCQKCQAKIRPDDGQKKDKNSIYDTVLFNRMMQESNQTDM